jgi:filamentous hemagglutinin family protein
VQRRPARNTFITARPAPDGARARFAPGPLAWALAVAFAWPVAPRAFANPAGGVAVQGAASFATSGSTLTVTTQNGAGTSHSAINWQSFSIPQGSTTNFVQPSAASMVINRVVTNTPSQIFGTLSSNGKLVLVNQSGITVGAGAVVDTAGFTASALGMSQADAVAGRLRFAADGSSTATGTLTVQGNIIARSGDVVLIAPNVEVAKTAVVQAPNGAAILAAGQQVEVTGRGIEGITMQVQAPSDRAVNLGTLRGDAVGIFASQLRHSGLIQAQGLTVSGGKVVLKATELAEVDGRVEATRTVNGQTTGGDVSVQARVVTLGGVVQVTGATGGSVSVSGQSIAQGGSIDASGASGGGVVQLVAERYVEQTTSARVSVAGGTGAGGSVRLQATADDGAILTSGTVTADGAAGGTVEILAPTIHLQAAQVSAEGTAEVGGDGGAIYLGGGKQGEDPLRPNSRYVVINTTSTLSSRARRSGQGGTLIVWSDGVTRFSGTANARGGAVSGDGGFIEVSGKDSLVFRGLADAGATAGARGTLLLDPKNITISAGGVATPTNLDPDPEGAVSSGEFGDTILMAGGKLVITDPYNDVNATDAGAIYVFDPTSGGLLGALRGSHANDQVGLNTGSYVEINPVNSNELLIRTPSWNGTAGAITLYSLSAPSTSVISAGNSFVGSAAGDAIGNYGWTLLNGASGSELLLLSPQFNGDRGAIIKIAATGGVRSGTVDATTAFVGQFAGDRVGDLQDIVYGNGTPSALYQQSGYNTFVIHNKDFNAGAGAITVGRVGSAFIGTLSASNSLVGGSSTRPLVGDSGQLVVGIPSGYFIAASPDWGDGGGANRGAVTWSSLAAPVVGAISASNSLVGGLANSRVGTGLVVDGAHGFALVNSPQWGDAGGANRGAVTRVSLSTGLTGLISASNSLVGSQAGDRVGSDGITLNSDGSYLVFSPEWGSQSGAITWGSASTGVTGTVDPTAVTGNSLVGSLGSRYGARRWDVGDRVLVIAPTWSDDVANAPNKGAFTVLNPLIKTPGLVSAANSVVGSQENDFVGCGASLASCLGGSYGSMWGDAGSGWTWVASANHDQGRGAFSFFYTGSDTGFANDAAARAPTGTIGDGVTTNLSVLGRYAAGEAVCVSVGEGPCDGYSSAADQLGQGGTSWVTNNYSGEIAVINPEWRDQRGSVTLLDLRNLAASIRVDDTNSVVGGTGAYDASFYSNASADRIGSNAYWVSGGRLLVQAPQWNLGRGAVASLHVGDVGEISSANALVGSYGWDSGEGRVDHVGGGLVWDLSNDNLLVSSPEWNLGRGAVTVADVDGLRGVVGSGNSMVGVNPDDGFGTSDSRQVLNLGRYVVVASPDWSGGRGAITWIDTTAPGGVVDETAGTGNSLVGTQNTDHVGSGGFVGPSSTWSGYNLPYSLALSPSWGDGSGAITRIDASVKSGVLGATNSFVGASSTDPVGLTCYYSGCTNITTFGNGAWILSSDNLGNGSQTGFTVFAPDSAVTGTIGSSNSILVSHADLLSGGGLKTDSSLGNRAVLFMPFWNTDRGAVRVIDTDAIASPGVTAVANTGATSASNALVGNAGDFVGGNWGGYEGQLHFEGPEGDKRIMVFSPQWNGGRGALTFIDPAAPLTGTVSASNSLVGASAGDFGAGNSYIWLDYRGLGSVGKIVLLNRYFDAGAGALTVIDPTNPLTGVISASNSLVGESGSSVNYYSANYVGYAGALVLSSPNYTDGSGNNIGFAALFTDSSAPVGVISSANALVGSANGDRVGTYVADMGSGKFVVLSPNWAGGTGTNRGAITWGSTSTSLTGAVGAANSLIGAYDNDHVGSASNGEGWANPVQSLSGSNGVYYVVTPDYHGGRGAYSFVNWGDVGLISTQTTIEGGYVGGMPSSVYQSTPISLGGGQWAVRFQGVGGVGSGQVFLTDGMPGGFASGASSPQLFADSASSDVTITNGVLTAITNTGTDILLQANNDITINADLITTAGNPGGAMSFEAGRSVHINANITTRNGDLTLIANSSNADAAYRDAGAGEIVVASGTTVNFGSGTASFTVDSAGQQAGDITVRGTVTGTGALQAATPMFFAVRGDEGAALVRAGTASIDAQGVQVSGDLYGAQLQSTGLMDITTSGSVGVESGYASARISAGSLQLDAGGQLSIVASGDAEMGTGAAAELIVLGDATITAPSGIQIQGSSYDGGYAQMVIAGQATVDTGFFSFNVRSGGGVGSSASLAVLGKLDYTAGEGLYVESNGANATASLGALDFTGGYVDVTSFGGNARLSVSGLMNVSLSDGLYVDGNTAGGKARLEAGSATIGANYTAIYAGQGAAEMSVAGNLTLNSGSIVYITGGWSTDAHASLSAGSASITAPGILVSAGEGVRTSAALAVSGLLTTNLTGDFDVRNTSSGTETLASVSAGSMDITAANLYLNAYSGAVLFTSLGTTSITTTGTISLQGGFLEGASASLISLGTASLQADTLDLVGGSGNGSFALLDPLLPGSTLTITANTVNVTGGSGAGAYAGIVSTGGDITFQTASLPPGLPALTLTPGTGVGADAAIYATNGDTLASLFGLPYLGQSDPFINGITDYGFAKYVPPVEPGDMLSGLSWLDGLLGRSRRWGTDSEILIEFCPAP